MSSRQTQPRQNYHEEAEAGVNRQINLELYACYVYQSMVSCGSKTFVYAKIHLSSNYQYAWPSTVLVKVLMDQPPTQVYLFTKRSRPPFWIILMTELQLVRGRWMPWRCIGFRYYCAFAFFLVIYYLNWMWILDLDRDVMNSVYHFCRWGGYDVGSHNTVGATLSKNAPRWHVRSGNTFWFQIMNSNLLRLI